METDAWPRSAGVAQSEGRLSPAVELEHGFVDLRASLKALDDETENEQLHNACLASLGPGSRTFGRPSLSLAATR
jgi:hypothetical protein